MKRAAILGVLLLGACGGGDAIGSPASPPSTAAVTTTTTTTTTTAPLPAPLPGDLTFTCNEQRLAEVEGTPGTNSRLAVGYEADDPMLGVVSEDHRTVVLDTGLTFEGWGLTVVDCVLDGLGMPDGDRARMNATRALDGMQEATWSPPDYDNQSYAASWTYHPDDGLNLILVMA